MKLKAPSACPVCGGQYEITNLTCKKCKSELGGHFSGCDFCNLSDEDARFVLTFLKCRGSIKDVEKELGISYPTVRGRLDGVIKRLGLKSSISPDEIREERKQVFDRLDKGEISADEAAELLRNL
ncbi:MAG: DUF2089 domain-containing protein [Eubacteriales bacterium]|nr:DUF2089 domain-containing protein [Eubacteriales bacterium]